MLIQLFETIDRVQRIHQLIESEITGTPEEFAKRLKLKRRQLYYILEEFKDYGAHIRYCQLKKSFYYVNDFEIKITISVSPLSPQEQENKTV